MACLFCITKVIVTYLRLGRLAGVGLGGAWGGRSACPVCIANSPSFYFIHFAIIFGGIGVDVKLRCLIFVLLCVCPFVLCCCVCVCLGLVSLFVCLSFCFFFFLYLFTVSLPPSIPPFCLYPSLYLSISPSISPSTRALTPRQEFGINHALSGEDISINSASRHS